MKKNNKGFTLAELLIVVAIIAVLVAISIPIFVSQLENSREATDAANIRSAYAEVSAQALSSPRKNWTTSVSLTQNELGWDNDNLDTIAGIDIRSITFSNVTDKIVVEYKAADATVYIAGIAVPKNNVTEKSN